MVVKIGFVYSFWFCFALFCFVLFCFFFVMERNIKINEEINNNSSNNQCSHRPVHRMKMCMMASDEWRTGTISLHFFNQSRIGAFRKIEKRCRSLIDCSIQWCGRFPFEPISILARCPERVPNTGNNKPQHIQFTIYIIF